MPPLKTILPHFVPEESSAVIDRRYSAIGKKTSADNDSRYRVTAGKSSSAIDCRFRTAFFANVDSGTSFVAFTNEITLGHDGWAQLAPFGDYPGQALIQRGDGSIEKANAVQRLDRAAAEAMVARFKSPWNRLKRYFTGCPIYAGHPDVPAFANDYPDKTAKGMIMDLETRASGLFCKPIFTEEGSELVETRRLRAFSAFWSAMEVGERAGADGKPVKIYRPHQLQSAGLTNQPNLPVQLLNERPSSVVSENSAEPLTPSIVQKELILNFLTTQGVTLANTAADAEILAALEQFGQRLAVAETTVASRSVDCEKLQADLANERALRGEALLDHALEAGRITAAQRPDWAARFAADFANTSAALAQLTPVVKTRAVTQDLGARKAAFANVSSRRELLVKLIRAEMVTNGGDYDRAFATVQKANPALFSAMQQPVNPS